VYLRFEFSDSKAFNREDREEQPQRAQRTQGNDFLRVLCGFSLRSLI